MPENYECELVVIECSFELAAEFAHPRPFDEGDKELPNDRYRLYVVDVATDKGWDMPTGVSDASHI